jgi:hypothetical protein
MNQWGSGALLTEGDLGDSANGPLLAVAIQAGKNNRFNSTSGVDLDNTIWGLDYTFKFKGFASVGEYHRRRGRPETGASFKDEGLLAQASYAFKAPGWPGGGFWELAFRYAQIDPSNLVSGNNRREIGGAFSYCYNTHNLKVQADFRTQKDDAGNPGLGTSSNEFRFQTQFIF